MSIGIYKYQNKINGNVYIGQSSNIEARYNQHAYDAAHADTRKVTGVDYAINKYGIENFTFEIIELCSPEEMNDREKYWIAYYDSFNNGYNRTIGGDSLIGEDHPRAILTEKEVYDIREQYGQGIKRSEVFKPYIEKGITERSLLKVWNCETWTHVHTDVYTEENKAIHKKQIGHTEDQIGLSSLQRALSQSEIDNMLKDYNNGMSINAIAKKYKRDNGTVEKYMSNPQQIQKVKYHGRRIKNIETGIEFKSISEAARWAKCGATTLTRHLNADGMAGKVPETGEPAHWQEIF